MGSSCAIKNGCFVNEKVLCVVVLKFDRMCRQNLVDGVLYEILGFVGNYYFERYVQ